MIREICRDEAFLAQKSEPSTAEDLAVAQDLLETLAAHKDGCVGMAANMIGVNNEKHQTRLKTFTGWTAQIIQHEIDHCEGIVI